MQPAEDCEKCLKVSCDDCPNAETTEDGWVLDENTLAIVLVQDYDANRTTRGGLAGKAVRAIKRVKTFATLEEAEQERSKIIREQLNKLYDVVSRMEKALHPGWPTTQEKVAVYESLLHDIQLNAEVTMNGDNVRKLISNICSWSYAHRSGNGELTEEEQQERINYAFRKLRDR